MATAQNVLEFEGDGPRSKRTNILRAAVRQFAQNGYESTKWSSIADEVGIGQTALYHYFESKAHCLLMIMRLELQRSLDTFQQVTDDAPSAREALSAAVVAAYDVTDEEVAQMRILQGNMTLLASPRKSAREENERMACRELVVQIQDQWTALLRQGMRDEEFPTRNPELLASIILGAVVSVWRWYRPSGSVSLPTVAREMEGACLRMAGVEQD